MTIRFTAAFRGENPVVSRAFQASVHLEAANDNYNGISSDKLMRATLRHFARHGISAAKRAKENAENAWLMEDFEGYTFWLEVCRALDRRMANGLTVTMDAANQTGAKQRGSLTALPISYYI